MSLAKSNTSFLESLKKKRPSFNFLNADASKLTTSRLGGALNLVQAQSFDSLKFFLENSFENNTEWRILGAGSNLLISDTGLSQPVIKLGRNFSGIFESFSKETLNNSFDLNAGTSESNSLNIISTLSDAYSIADKIKITFGASTSLMSLSRECSKFGLSGLEFAAGIPAELGGAVRMNAGAHGSQISSIFSKAWIVNEKAEVIERAVKDMNFNYRSSSISPKEIVLAAELEFTKLEKEETTKVRRESLDYRKKTQPLSLPSAGSVFKNPIDVDISAGALLEELGFKGKSIGGLSFSKLHANWIVKNSNDALSSDFKLLLEEARKAVKEKFDFELESEVRFWDGGVK